MQFLKNLFASKPTYSSVEDVIAEVLTRLKDVPTIGRVEQDPDDPLILQIWEKSENASTGTINLHNVAQHVLGSGLSAHEQREQIELAIQSFAMTFDKPHIIVADIMMMVRHVGYLDAVRKRDEDGQNKSFMAQHLAGDLETVLMQETEASFITLTAEDVTEAGLDPDQVWREAEANLRRALGQLQVDQLADKLIGICLPGAEMMAGSVLLSPSKLDEIQKAHGFEKVLIGAPNRHTVFMADAGREDAANLIGHLIVKDLAEDHPQSSYIFERDLGGNLQPFLCWDGTAFASVN